MTVSVRVKNSVRVTVIMRLRVTVIVREGRWKGESVAYYSD